MFASSHEKNQNNRAPNRRLQLTAFGAQDRAFFDSFRSASAAAEAQHVGRAPSSTSHLQSSKMV